MGLIYANIELINGDDLALNRREHLDESEIKRIIVSALVDTGSYMLCINEVIQEQLKFPIMEKRKTETADGRVLEFDVAGSVELKFENRRTLCNAMILPGDSEILLGAIPLEDMDVLFNSQRQQLIVNPAHPYYAQMKLK